MMHVTDQLEARDLRARATSEKPSGFRALLEIQG